MATCSEKFCKGKFFDLVNPKDAFVVVECKDARARRMLEFLVPILYLEKPIQVTITIANTIYGALLGEREVDWMFVIWDVVKRLLAEVRKSKPTPICSYIFNLYQFADTMKSEDKNAYMIGEAMMKHNVKPDQEDKLAGEEDSEQESLSLKEIVEL